MKPTPAPAQRVRDYLEDPWEMMVYRALRDAADAAAPCPTCDELCDLIGCDSSSTPVRIIHQLEARGLIRVKRYQRARQVFVVATGKWTRAPASTSEPWRETAVTLSALQRERPDDTIELLLAADRAGKPLAAFMREMLWAGLAAIQRHPGQG